MKQFSFRNAWVLGLRFFSGAALNHAILLVGLGILFPIFLQLLLFGEPTVMADSGEPGPDETAVSNAVPFVTAGGFVLQTGGFFASWRLGLARGETLGRALVFGLLAGLMFSVGLGIILVVVGVVFGMITPAVAAVAVLIAFVAIFAIAWTVYAALFAIFVCLLFLLALGIGGMSGDLTLAATMVGGSGFVWNILIAASLLLLWLAARLSCTTLVMAERRSLNLFAAMRESWSLTWDDEWRILRYLALLGFAMAVVMFAAIALAGAGLASNLAAGSEMAFGQTVGLLLIALSVPLAYLSVLVPAGIYLELVPADAAAAEVFA